MTHVTEPKCPYVTIDSGINTGVALFKPGYTYPLYVKCFSSTVKIGGKTNFAFDIKANQMLNEFWNFMRMDLSVICTSKSIEYPGYSYIEEPEFYYSDKGLQAAQTGSLKKLLYTYSIVKWMCYQLFHLVEDIKPKTWKGQLSKLQVDYRIQTVIPGAKFDEHISDAVGIGLFIKGLI